MSLARAGLVLAVAALPADTGGLDWAAYVGYNLPLAHLLGERC